ncbi:MAG: CCA tRNA nucleotidyltransferase [Pseudomonadota bacterium]
MAKHLLNDAKVAALLRVLNVEKDSTRIVGGAVRNALLDEPIGDIDFATKILPQRVSELCEAAGFKAVPTGIEFGTVTIVINKQPFEVTTLREDIETNGRHAVVKFGTSWEKDAARRDFTINALYLDADGNVHAPIGGLDDIKARRVCFIGEAQTRIREDYLRIWRFFRFFAQYGEGDLDNEGLRACMQERKGLAGLSAERVRQELFKLLNAPRAAEAIEAMRENGLTTDILGVQRIARFKKYVAGNNEPTALNRLAALCVWTNNDADLLSARLKLSRAEERQLNDLASTGIKLRTQPDEKQARVLLYHYLQVYDAAIKIASAGNEEGWKDLIKLPQRHPVPEFPVKGADLIALGYSQGPELGEVLKRLEQKWIGSDFSLPQDALLKFARN